MENILVTQLSTLGHGPRLDIFRLLMRRYPDAVAAGEIGAALGVKPSTLSAYLGALHQAGLVVQEREGTSLRYRVAMDTTDDMMAALFSECCRGRVNLQFDCAPDPQNDGRPFNVLFLCVGNSARSIMAETLLRDMGGDRFRVYSAGVQPQSTLNPLALEVLRQKEHDTSALSSKHLSVFQAPEVPQMDFVFTVCDVAANEDCPAWAGQPVSGHWGLPDPVKAQGSVAERGLAFQATYGALRNRIAAFTALPLESLERAALQKAVDHIAEISKED